MKIVDKRIQVNIFEYIKTGQCFMIDDQLFIKVGFFNEEEGGEVFNCVCLNDGSFYYASNDDAIEFVNAEIIID
jgi:hypothetical protein